MHCGCISLGDVQCDGCHRKVEYLERYLTKEEEKEGTTLRFCLDCSLNRGYACYKREKGEQMTTFFTE